MSKFSKFYPEKATELVFQWVLIFFAKFAQIIATAEIMLYMTRTDGFYSMYTNIQWHNCHLPIECPDETPRGHPLPWWPCIISLFGSWSIAQFNVSWLSWAQQSISTRFSLSMSEILFWYTICCNAPPNCIINQIKIRAVWRSVFRFSELNEQCGVNDVPALRPAETDWGALQQMVYHCKISGIDQLKHLD